MSLSDLLVALLGGVCLWAIVIAGLRVGGYRVEFKLKAIRRRRRPIEPDEHTAFL